MRTQFRLLQDDGHKSMTVFIHGYLAIKNQDEYQALVDCIHSLQLPGKVYFVYWGSGSFQDVMTIGTVAGRAGAIALKAAARSIPFGLALEMAIRVASFIGHFKYYESRAEDLGKSLITMIRRRVQHNRRMPITLVGHSLGARVIHTSLKTSDWSGLNLKNIVLLAGKTPRNGEDGEWTDCLEDVSGKVYNFHSNDDSVLGLTPDFEECVGAYRLSGPPGKVVNIQTGLGHTDYWDNLRRCFESKRMPTYTRSKRYAAPVYCDRCECTLSVLSDVLHECSECGLVFRYNHEQEKFHYSKETPEPLRLSCPHCDDEDGDLFVQFSGEYTCNECGETTTVKRRGARLTYEKPCADCDGNGFVECDACDGDGGYDCPVCDGDGELECGHCSGDGCGHCNDDGERDCRRCDGTGRIECRRCDEDCEVKCTECKGRGITFETQVGSGGHLSAVCCAPSLKPFR